MYDKKYPFKYNVSVFTIFDKLAKKFNKVFF